MLDEDAARARRSLEQEAIALVNLSNPTKFRPAASEASDASSQSSDSVLSRRQVGKKAATPGSSSSIHPLLQLKANLLARRDGKLAARKLRVRDPKELTQALVVDASASAAERRDSDVAVKLEDGAVAADAPMELLDGSISMKSLLVTLKKRKLQHQPSDPTPPQPATATASSTSDSVSVASDAAASEVTADDGAAVLDSAKLPSFRDVFQPQPQQPLDPAVDAPSATSSASTELKCKYRTGKCHNVRALKSCGDYHNLCNYHRLRANANQRKLDRKKKEQRQQQQATVTVAAGASSSSPFSSRASSPCSSATNVPLLPTAASSHAAAAALASLVAAQPQLHDASSAASLPPRACFRPSGTALEAAAGAASTLPKGRRNSNSTASGVRPKQEDACSY
ncbi:hypothetical protein BBJ28_00001567 [Nothophytophthora sp. Chile5]|nr:hypothetical protein BBJ28_00001567 [Nothophytophthora sp. Chile5]